MDCIPSLLDQVDSLASVTGLSEELYANELPASVDGWPQLPPEASHRDQTINIPLLLAIPTGSTPEFAPLKPEPPQDPYYVCYRDPPPPFHIAQKIGTLQFIAFQHNRTPYRVERGNPRCYRHDVESLLYVMTYHVTSTVRDLDGQRVPHIQICGLFKTYNQDPGSDSRVSALQVEKVKRQLLRRDFHKTVFPLDTFSPKFHACLGPLDKMAAMFHEVDKIVKLDGESMDWERREARDDPMAGLRTWRPPAWHRTINDQDTADGRFVVEKMDELFASLEGIGCDEEIVKYSAEAKTANPVKTRRQSF